MARRYYSSIAARTTLASGVDDTTTTLVVTAVSNWPASYPYTLIVDQDTVNEEIVEVSARSGTTLTVTRGVDGTSAVAHSSGAAVNHGVSARDFDEPNEFINGTGVVTSTMIEDGTIVNADINDSAAIAQSKVADLTSDLASKLPYSYGTATPSTTDSGFLWFDSNSTPAVAKYWDGSAFQNVAPPGGMELITSESFSAVSSVSVNGCFTSTYDNYALIVHATIAASETDAYLRLRASGSDATGSNYLFFNQASGVNGTGYNQNSTGTTQLTAGRLGSSGTSSLVVNMFRPNDAVRTTFQAQNVANGTTTTFIQAGGGLHSLSTAYDGFTFYPASSTMTGALRVYGYKD